MVHHRTLFEALAAVWIVAAIVGIVAALLAFSYSTGMCDSSQLPDAISVVPTPNSPPPSQDGSSQTANVILGLIAMSTLYVAYRQWRLERTKAGGKGVQLSVNARPLEDGSPTRAVEARVRMVGPAVRHEVGLRLERDGTEFAVTTAPPDGRPSMSCDDDPLEWRFEVQRGEMSNLWLIVFWAEAQDDNLNSSAAAWRLGPPPDTYIWKNYPGLRLRVLLQGWTANHGSDWLRRLIHEPRPTGRWKKEPATLAPAGAQRGEGPIELGEAPDA